MVQDDSHWCFSVKQLADMAGVSSRTLRYYDQIGLLCPRRAANGYRVYGRAEVRRLQHILLLRSCDMPLTTIGRVLEDPDFQLSQALCDHLRDLCRQRSHLDRAIAAAQAALEGLEQFTAMSDQEKFKQLKRQSVQQFEEEYGEEARCLYGDNAIDQANERMLAMSQRAWDLKEELEERIKVRLAAALAAGDPTSPAAREVAEMHAQWIRIHWGEGAYSPQAHCALVQGYLADPRFIDYYDSAAGPGATEFLRDVIMANVGRGAE